jgi:pimeloyl-ACP methyl ester carboxylesterase
VVALIAAIMPRNAIIGGVRRLRTVNATLPAELDRHDGIAFSIWLPPERVPILGGVVILHGAGSCKESHYDYARAVLPVGFAAIAFDQRGHGESDGPLDGRALDDVRSMASLLRARSGADEMPIALRGSSMGGYLAIAAASRAEARAVVAICPASADGLRRSLRVGDHRFDADVPALDELLAAHELDDIVDSLEIPVLLLHAEGDEVVPVQISRELAGHLHMPGSRLIEVPGGHHRSVQHDGELQAVSIRFLEHALGAR